MFRVKSVLIPLAAIALMACQTVPITQSPRGAATSPPDIGATVTPIASSEPIAVQNMRLLLRQWLGEAGANAQLVNVLQTEWPDACFGAGVIKLVANAAGPVDVALKG